MYLVFRNGKFRVSVNKKHPEREGIPLATSETPAVYCYCPEHGHLVEEHYRKDKDFLDFFAKAARKARNCRELKFLRDCWHYLDRELATALITGNQQAAKKALRKRKTVETLRFYVVNYRDLVDFLQKWLKEPARSELAAILLKHT